MIILTMPGVSFGFTCGAGSSAIADYNVSVDSEAGGEVSGSRQVEISRSKPDAGSECFSTFIDGLEL